MHRLLDDGNLGDTYGIHDDQTKLIESKKPLFFGVTMSVAKA